MIENTQEKSLGLVKEKGVMKKIVKFFRKLFHRNKYDYYEYVKMKYEKSKAQRNRVIENINNIQDEETKILKLQKDYNEGLITSADLSLTQIKQLCDWYDKEIENLRKINQFKKQKLVEYKQINR